MHGQPHIRFTSGVITDTPNRVTPLPPFKAYNLYSNIPSHLSSRQAPYPEQPSSKSPENKSSTADISQPIAAPQTPFNDAQLNTATQFAQPPQFAGAAEGQLQTGFNFGAQPRQLNFGFGPPGFNQDINTQPAGIPQQGTNAFQQNFPPLDFRPSAPLNNQFSLGQSESPLPNSAAQQNFGQYSGNINNLPSGIPQIQGFGQFNGFQFPSSNIGQGFSQQLNYPSFAPGGLYSGANQSLTLASAVGDQRSVVGFYGDAPNIGGYTFNDATLPGQQQSLLQSGFVDSNTGQFPNGDSQIVSGAPQLGTAGGQGANGFSSLSFNPAAFQNGGAPQDAGFSSTVRELKNVPLTSQPSKKLQK